MDVLITPAEDEPFLRDELRRTHPAARCDGVAPGVLAVHGPSGSSSPATTPAPNGLPSTPASTGTRPLVFARQLLPQATEATAATIKGWAELLVAASRCLLPSLPPWRLHVWPRYGEGRAGLHRAQLITETFRDLLGRHDRAFRRRLETTSTPFTPDHALIQLMLTAPDQGFLSVAQAPTPFDRRVLLAPFPAGEVPVAVDKSAPSRAFAKLVEAEARLGVSIRAGDRCVDLGASPGSWSYVALRRGASVIAVDRSPLRADLMAHPRLRFQAGDAFAFRPDPPVDWLICDVIAAPQRSIALVRRWLDEGWCRQLVVTVKFKGSAEYAELDGLKDYLPEVCSEFRMTRLCANRNEACVAGVAVPPRSAAG